VFERPNPNVAPASESGLVLIHARVPITWEAGCRDAVAAVDRRGRTRMPFGVVGGVPLPGPTPDAADRAARSGEVQL